ncbi:MAG: leucine--tRNA ligase [Phycisphaeraceae bacterium]|nr:leucine--tRNA ligase [Phycisphaeraceae bacterium]
MRYDFSAIEQRWQQYWAERQVFKAANPGEEGFDPHKPKYYVLDMFPYPSGVGLHVGHPLGYIATDIVARYKRMRGFNVLHPMGYDAFGLPAEQFAVEHGVHPRITTEKNIANMTRQLKRLGLSYDWDRSLATTDETYYRWTQWIFLQLFNSWFDPAQSKARPIGELVRMLESEQMYVGVGGELVEPTTEGLEALAGDPIGVRKWHELSAHERALVLDEQRMAYVAEVPVNWCPALGTVLANEEVTVDGRSERGNHPVYRRPLRQWMLRITAYAERLLADLDGVDWPEPIKLMQRNWIGRSEGAKLDFPLAYDAHGSSAHMAGEAITVFTTRPDTIFGATYMVLAPEHPLVETITTEDQWQAVMDYRKQAEKKSEIERQGNGNGGDENGLLRKKTGVFTGSYALNPANSEKIPIWIADYVMMGYGTGAIMAVPAHDERDFEFASQMGLPIRDVVYTQIQAAIHGFAMQYDPSPLGGQDPVEAMADFVGLCVTHPNIGHEEAWAMVAQRRRPRSAAEEVTLDSRGGRERRGTIAMIWQETLAPYVGDDLHGLLDAARMGRLIEHMGEAVTVPGFNVNSANEEMSLNGMKTDQAKQAMIEWLEKRGLGAASRQYKLRDWLFSRQRYWGEPFPIIYDAKGQAVGLEDKDLPVRLPEMEDFRPAASDDPQAPPRPPLARAPESWRQIERSGGRYTREFNTMPQWAGSCWYYLRFCDAQNSQRFVGPKAEQYWMKPGVTKRDGQANTGGIDLYVGGAEHAVLHLLYARFWHKVLFDLGHVTTPEPFGRLFNQGYIQAYAYRDERGIAVAVEEVVDQDNNPANQVEDRNDRLFFHQGKPVRRELGKMGKSLKNAIAPDAICEQYGCDTLRLYEMYLGPLDQSKLWRTRDILGVHRFLQRLWRVFVEEETGRLKVVDQPAPENLRRLLHKTIKRVSEAMENLAFNVGIAALIELNNELVGRAAIEREIAEPLALCVAPLAPHLAEELWQRLGHGESLAYQAWPKFDPALLVEEQVEYPVQINGKLRGRVVVAAGTAVGEVEKAALSDQKIQACLNGMKVLKVIVVAEKMVNVVAK